MLIDQSNISHRWCELLSRSLEIDIATAWITSEGLVRDLLEFVAIEGRKVRVVSGCDDYLTSPVALRLLFNASLVRIGVRPVSGWFHPKVYLFKNAAETLCWVGSANFTDAGFGRNVELVTEFIDDGRVCAWMDQLWTVSGVATTEWLTMYEARYHVRQAREQTVEKLPPLPPPPTAHVAESLIIFLSPMASAPTIAGLMRAAQDDVRIREAWDFNSMSRELHDSGFSAISLRSYLWLVGWCNTDLAYRKSSTKYAQPLAQSMFGYVPDRYLAIGTERIDLKSLRYGHMRDAAMINALLALHRVRLS